MKKIGLDQTLKIIANVAVIAGIFFLALETRQNSQMMRSQTRSQIAQSVSDSLYRVALSEYPTLFTISSFEGLSDADATRVRGLILATLRNWENIHYQYRNGLYDESEFVREKEIWRLSLERPTWKDVFCGLRDAFSADFVGEIDLLLQTGC